MAGNHAANTPLQGYAAVAAWVALDQDNETFVFRKFDRLGARNLLHLQSELLAIERELDLLDGEDAKAATDNTRDLAAMHASRTWAESNRGHGDGSQDAARRQDLIERLRAKIKEYHEALLLQSQISQLHRPSKRVLETYQHWLRYPEPMLGGRAKQFLNNENDLVALKPVVERDYLSQFLSRYWPVKDEPARDGRTRIGRFEERRISVAVSIISIIVAAFLLIGAIASFYVVQTDKAKLGMIAVFTAAFALSMMVLTNARRAEIFAGTAAYAAVLVVFVSGNISISQGD